MYLDEATIDATLDVFASLPAGSRFAFDVFLRPRLEGTRTGKAAQRGVRMTYGELFTWSMPMVGDFDDSARALLEGRDLELIRARATGPEDCRAYGMLDVGRA